MNNDKFALLLMMSWVRAGQVLFLQSSLSCASLQVLPVRQSTWPSGTAEQCYADCGVTESGG